MKFNPEYSQHKGFVEVSILGSRYKLKSTPEETPYLESLAKFVNDKMIMAQRKNPNFKLSKIAILTALNLADELLRVKESGMGMPEDYNMFAKKIEMLVQRLDNALT